MIIAIYVDNILLIGASVSQTMSINKAFKTRFSIFDLGVSLFYLGITVCRDRSNTIPRLGQAGYLEKVLQDHNMLECKPLATHIDGRLIFLADGYFSPAEFCF